MVCRKTKKRVVMRVIGTVLILVGALCALMAVAFDAFIRPTLDKLLDYKCRTVAERVISDCVFSRLTGADDIGNVMNFTFDSDGRIAAMSADQAKINSIKALVNDGVNDGLADIKGQTVGISVGTLSGIPFMYGMGPELTFFLEPKGRADTKLVSSFKNSGINQTIHSIILEVDTELSPMIPGFSGTVELSYDILLAQTVIVGSVPGQYSYIVLDQENLSELADIDI